MEQNIRGKVQFIRSRQGIRWPGLDPLDRRRRRDGLPHHLIPTLGPMIPIQRFSTGDSELSPLPPRHATTPRPDSDGLVPTVGPGVPRLLMGPKIERADPVMQIL